MRSSSFASTARRRARAAWSASKLVCVPAAVAIARSTVRSRVCGSVDFSRTSATPQASATGCASAGR
ncbi:hypothetical protein ACFQFC_09090 [Amorphoplanes digitatis]|uniref:hypothetical protein n=1 Tax=Actinoplanes digitatis TaxID=1868 RepID=UPI00362054BD